MKLTEFFRLRMPDGTDPVNIEDFNDNFEVIDRELKKRISDDGSASDVTVGFEVAESRQPLKSGEKLSVLMGKVHRFFTDLKTVAFSGKYGDLSERPSLGGASTLGVANNCTTTEAGFALDARQGKTLMDKSNKLSRDLHTLNDSGAIKGLDAREDGVYITYSTGADTVTKKLGSGDSVTKTFNSGVFSKSASGTINVSGYRYVLINSIQIGNPNASSSSSGRYSFGDISADFRRSPASYDNPARMPNWFDLNGREVIQWSYNSSDNDNMIVSYTLVE